MTKIELGTVGAVLEPGSGDAYHDAARAVEGFGIPTFWMSGGPMEGLWQLADLVRATEHVRVGGAILSVDRFPPDDVTVLYEELEYEQPGRFVVGLGGAHGPRPFETLATYLDALAVPPE